MTKIPMDVFIIDDDEFNLRQIKRLLSEIPIDFGRFCLDIKLTPILAEKINNRVNENNILNKIRGSRPSVAIIDIRLEGDDLEDHSGIDLLRKINSMYPDCRIILVSSYFSNEEQRTLKECLNISFSTIDRSKGYEIYRKELIKGYKEALSRYVKGLDYINYRYQKFVEKLNNNSKTMWGMVIGPEHTGIRINPELPIPFLNGNSVMVEVIKIGICATNKMALGKEDPPKYEIIDFHEAFGRVVWTGERVRRIRIGDFVVPMVRRCSPWDSPETGSKISPGSFRFFPCHHKKHGNCYPRADECPHGEYKSPNGEKRSGYKSRGTGKCHGFGSQYFIDHEDWLIRIDPEVLKDKELGEYMIGRYILTEPLSIAWKMHRQIKKHHNIKELAERVLFIGLGPIGLLSATVMTYLHPTLQYTAIDLADEENARVKMLKILNKSIRYFQAIKDDEVPKELNNENEIFHIIVEATGHPEKILKYALHRLAPGGILVLLSVAAKDIPSSIPSEIFTQLVKGNNILMGSVNSSREDFEDSIAFMEKVIGNRESILEKMITHWEIDDTISENIIRTLGETEPKDRDEIKVVLKAKEYTEGLRAIYKKNYSKRAR